MIQIGDFYKKHKIISWIICAILSIPWLLILWNFGGLWGAIIASITLLFIIPWILLTYIVTVLIFEKKFKLLWYLIGTLMIICIGYTVYYQYEERKSDERNAWHRDKYSQQLIGNPKKTAQYYEDYEMIKYNQDLSNEEQIELIKELDNVYWIQ